MSETQSISKPVTHLKWGMKGLAICLLLISWLNTSHAQDIQAYAKPNEEYIYIYTLDHVYETTLFRSEKFDPILETEDGYIILLRLGGKPKLVLLPFESRDRKIAEKKYRGVGVTYTAFLTFTEGHLPFDANQYYEVLKRDKGKLTINYSLHGFQKNIEVPESQFTVKSAFEYQLEKSLTEIRADYRTYSQEEERPETWSSPSTVSSPGTLTERPTHIALVKNKILANNFQSIRTAPATDLKDVLAEVKIDQHGLRVVPVPYTHETPETAYYFVRIQGYQHPVVIKDFNLPKGSDGYSKVVRVHSNQGLANRFLEITDSVHIEFYPDYHILSQGDIAAIRKGTTSHFLIAEEGEYEIAYEDVELYTPAEFLQHWGQETTIGKLLPGDRLYTEFLKFQFPPSVRSESEWKSLKQLQDLAKLNQRVAANGNASVHSLIKALSTLEAGAGRLGLTLHTSPQANRSPIPNNCYFNYWKSAFNELSAQAVRERNQDILKRQILRSKVLIGETQNQPLIDFLSAQIYTYSNYLPAPLNRINQLESDPPLAASRFILFNFPLDYGFRLNPVTLDSLELEAQGPNTGASIPGPSNIATDWLLNIDALQYWNAAILAKKEEVYDPAYWKAIEEIQIAEREKRLEIARKRFAEAQTAQEEHSESLKHSKLPWIAASAWLALLLITNTGFFALSKVMPIRQS